MPGFWGRDDQYAALDLAALSMVRPLTKRTHTNHEDFRSHLTFGA